MQKKSFIKLLLVLFVFITGCSSEELESEQTEVNSLGLTYTFQLPKKWNMKENFQNFYGTQAVYGAEDSMSKSEMIVFIFPKDAIEEEGFGERTREEIAQNNNYENTEDVYMKEYTVNGYPAYKYTSETYSGDVKKWAHYYCVFSDNGIIQFMYYSAQDSGYEERVKRIDASVDTVQETAFNQEEAADNTDSAAQGHIVLKDETTTISIAGLRQLTGDDNKNLLAVQFLLENKSSTPVFPTDWVKKIELKQTDQLLKQVPLPENNTSYELETLMKNMENEAAAGETLEGVLIYELKDESEMTLTIDESLESSQTNYTMQVPEKNGGGSTE